MNFSYFSKNSLFVWGIYGMGYGIYCTKFYCNLYWEQNKYGTPFPPWDTLTPFKCINDSSRASVSRWIQPDGLLKAQNRVSQLYIIVTVWRFNLIYHCLILRAKEGVLCSVNHLYEKHVIRYISAKPASWGNKLSITGLLTFLMSTNFIFCLLDGLYLRLLNLKW